MANRNIDERFRKPRRTKGTPFYYQRNLYSLGVIGLSGICWVAYELWPQSQKLRTSVQEGKFRFSPEYEQHLLAMRMTREDPTLEPVIAKLRERAL